MTEWIRAGGFGMVLVAAAAVVSFAAAVRAIARPTESNLRVLRAAPALMLGLALFGSGLGAWAVVRHMHAAPAAEPMLIGLLEAAQPLTLGGLVTAVLATSIFVAQARAPRRLPS